ncbi:MAG: WavE lipopolysaccharide synthesis family protein [Candidatus Magasanikbacteria bacterium]|nr:WavE lipopolysaccharide synthesis family protein [Candidatus Magasanikbacteria bacterium]
MTKIKIEKFKSCKNRIVLRLKHFFCGYITFHIRPKNSSDINIWHDSLVNYSKVAIIIQGPLLKKNNFTLETVRLYKKIFNKYAIILSTWEDEDVDYINEIKKEGIVVLLNKKPDYSGISHINYQIVSTSNAIAKAQEIGVEYILKTRTDLRIYNPNSIEFLVNFISLFPVDPLYKQKKRIAGISLNTFKYRPYSISDMVLFGCVDDMVDYWGCGLDMRKDFANHEKIGDWSRARLCEVYLSANYLETKGRKLKWTIEDSWSMFANYFCIFDQQSLDIYWHKYARNLEYRRLEYKNLKNSQELTFSEWLNMFYNLNNKKNIPEYILSQKFKEKIKQ